MWLWFTLLASMLQVVRNSTSKQLSRSLKPYTISFVRFAYSLPLVVVYIVVLYGCGYSSGTPDYPSLLIYSLLGATLQTVGYCLLISLFQTRSFAVAINLTKTDTIFAYLLSLTFLSQRLSALKVLGVALAGSGSIVASSGTLRTTRGCKDRTLWIGLLSGLMFAATSVMVVKANGSYLGGDILVNAAVTLLVSLLIQSAQLFLFVYLKDKEDLVRSLHHLWRDLLVGITSGLGSICWFTAFSLEHVALVKAVGEVEFLFSVAVGYLWFRETLNRVELLGITMTLVGVLLLL